MNFLADITKNCNFSKNGYTLGLPQKYWVACMYHIVFCILCIALFEN